MQGGEIRIANNMTHEGDSQYVCITDLINIILFIYSRAPGQLATQQASIGMFDV